MRTRAEQKAATRARLIDAAAVVVAAKGVEGASVDAIASAAGVTTGALYASFRTKGDLLAALVEERSTDLSHVPLEQLADEVGERWAEALDRDPVSERLVLELLLAAGRDEALAAMMRERVTRTVDALTARIESEDLPVRLDPHEAALLLQVLAAGTAALRPVLGDAMTPSLLTRAVDLVRGDR
jgi:AcrR family transcriptional regulator